MNDLELLQRFEPIVRYTEGEHFLPMDVDRYVAECSLWEARPDGKIECLVPEGQLSVARLLEFRSAPHGTVQYMRFVESLTALEAARFVAAHESHFKRSRGRLARVGLLSRTIDALFSITLIMRGRVPGGTAAAADDAYRRMHRQQEKYVYYGRVVRQGGFVCLQYWFFFAMNDWRSSFHGLNDHESDWEQVVVFLEEKDLAPQWVAYASHDFAGDDLRRRWDDPEVRREGEHPIVYAGAGSHASYFSPGEYMHEVALPFSAPLTRVVRTLDKFWHDTLKLGVSDELEEGEQTRASGVLVVPFIDYARGDGPQIGPGRPRQWEPRLLPDTFDTSTAHPEAWAHHYRGLWGLFARDPIAGENAPAGPKYNRDGTIRRSWADSLGWAGLDKVTPTDELLTALDERGQGLRDHETALQAEIDAKMVRLRDWGLEAEAMLDLPYLKKQYAAHRKQMTELSDELTELRATLASEHALLEAVATYRQRLERGERLPARAHLQAAHRPTSEEAEQMGRLAEAWAALSVGMLILGFLAVLLTAPGLWLTGLVSVVAVISFVEALFQREAQDLIQRAVTGLALISLAVLVYQFAQWVLVGLIIALGVFIIFDNVRELTR
jgi:hypothetical protein